MTGIDIATLRAACEFVETRPAVLPGDLRLLVDIADAGPAGLKLAELRERTGDYGSYTRVTRALARLEKAGLVQEAHAPRADVRGRRSVLAYTLADGAVAAVVTPVAQALAPSASKSKRTAPRAKAPAETPVLALAAANVYTEDAGCRDVF